MLGPKGSGKTRLASVIELVAFNPIGTDGITTAQLFRSVEAAGGTPILDEQDARFGKVVDSDKLSIRLGGYKKGGGALRSAASASGYQAQRFDTTAPKY